MATAHSHPDHGHSTKYYVKIWAVLMVLLFVSVAGPMLGNKIITLITAFGIAFVKATMVAAYFMHLNIEKKYISYILLTMLVAMGLFFIAVAPDVMNADGRNWTNQASHNLIEYYKTHNAAEEGHKATGETPHK